MYGTSHVGHEILMDQWEDWWTKFEIYIKYNSLRDFHKAVYRWNITLAILAICIKMCQILEV